MLHNREGAHGWHKFLVTQVGQTGCLAQIGHYKQMDSVGQIAVHTDLLTGDFRKPTPKSGHNVLERYLIIKGWWLGIDKAGRFWVDFSVLLHKLQEQIFCFCTSVTCILNFWYFVHTFSYLLTVWKPVLRCLHLDSLWNIENFSTEMGSSASTKNLL